MGLGPLCTVAVMYVIYEYLACIALALFLGAFAFGVSVVALIGQEGGKRLVAGSRALGQHAATLLEESRSKQGAYRTVQRQVLVQETDRPD